MKNEIYNLKASIEYHKKQIKYHIEMVEYIQSRINLLKENEK